MKQADLPVPQAADTQLAQEVRTGATVRTRQADLLFKVELALSRLESGDYGYCVVCRSPIALDDLNEDPSAVICGACKKP